MFEEYKEIIKYIEIPDEYGQDEDGGECWQASEINYTLSKETNHHFYFGTGASKAVFIAKDLDFVIKTNFNGYFYEPQEYNEETDMWEYADDYEFYEFTHCHDYTGREVDIYDEAEMAGMEEIFVQNFCIDADRKIYVQEKCIPFPENDEEKRVSSKKAKDAVSKLREEEITWARRFCTKWLEDCIDYYGLERTEELLEYATDVSSDYHSDNYGYLARNNAPVIFDYAGYND